MLINMHYAQINHAGEPVAKIQKIIAPPVLHSRDLMKQRRLYELRSQEGVIWYEAIGFTEDIYTGVEDTLC